MKNYFIELFNEQNRKTTIVLLIYSIVSIASGLIKGIDDNFGRGFLAQHQVPGRPSLHIRH